MVNPAAYSSVRKLFDISACALKLHLSRLGLAFPPFSLAWHITWRCNARCPSCGWGKSDGEYRSRLPRELSTRRVKEVIDEASGDGCRRIGFSGGEPLLREDIYEIIRHAKGRGLVVEISSNGLGIDEDTAGRLVGSGVDSIHISLDSPDELHDRLRGVPGAFQSADRALARLSARRGERPFYLGINAVVCAVNIEKLSGLCGYAARRELDGVSFQAFNPGQARNRAARAQLRVRREQVPRLRAVLREIVNAHRSILRNSEQYIRGIPDFCEDPLMAGEPCVAGLQQMYVFPFGEISPCAFLPRVGSLRERSYRDLIHSRGVRELRERAGKKACAGCWCPGTHEFNTLLKLKRISSAIKVAGNYLQTY